jgi:HEAT repeat protein
LQKNKIYLLKICRGLKHSSDIVRRHAVIGLGLLKSEYIMTFLFDVLEDKSFKVQKEAYNICKKINSEMLYEYMHFKISQENNTEILSRYSNLFKDSLTEEEKKIYDYLINKIEDPDNLDLDDSELLI